jgi:phosphoglycolate phosphatase
MNDRRSYDLVLFDLDGTLLDTSMDLGDSVNTALAFLGYPPLDDTDYRDLVGDGVRNLCFRSLRLAATRCRRPFPTDGDGSSPDLERSTDIVLAKFRTHYAEHLNRRTTPYPGIPAMLDQLQREGVCLAVLSNKSQEFTHTLVRLHFPSIRFCYIIGDGGGFLRKPDPSAVLHILRETGCAARRTVLFGDGENDAKVATAAGIDFVAVGWGYRTKAVLAEAGAVRFVDAPEEIASIVVVRAYDEEKS